MEVNLVEQNIQSMEFPEIPTGEYLVLIQSIEQDIDKKVQSPYLKITLQILEGQFQNQKLWDRWKGVIPGTDGAFGESTKYSLSRAKSIMKALGLPNITNTDVLVNKQVRVKAKLKDGFTNVESYLPPTPSAATEVVTNSQQQAPAGVTEQQQSPQQGGNW